MILAEIADKMPPAAFYIGAALLLGVGTAIALTFLKGVTRFIGFGIVVLVAAFLAWILQPNTDLVQAARKEMGPSYLILSRFWLVGSVIIAITLTHILQGAKREINSARKVSRKKSS